MVVREWGEFVFAPPVVKVDAVILLPPDEAHHLFRVRRVPLGAEVFVTDGAGMVYRCVTQARNELEIVESLPGFGEPPQPVILCVATLKGDTNREVVDAAVQLGATEIRFFQATHSEGKLKDEKLEKLKRVAVTAIKQCGRARLPELAAYASLAAALATLPAGTLRLLAHPWDGEAEAAPLRWRQPLALIVGPEGGLTAAEVETALQAGAVPLRLAARRLRSETAVAAGLSYVLGRIGECAVNPAATP